MRDRHTNREHSIVAAHSGRLSTRAASLARRGLLMLEHTAARAGRRGLGWTPLHIAAIGDHKREADILVARGDDVNARDRFGHTPLFFARSAYVAQVLVAHGADPNARREDGATPLHRAARAGSRQVARVLLQAGADANASQAGLSPLHIAARAGHWAVAELLLAAGADADAVDDCGRTALELAESAGYQSVAELVRRYGG